MKILNLTQHVATPEQVAQGVFEPADKTAVQALLTFNTLPTGEEISKRAFDLAELAHKAGAEAAMIGGAPYLMSWLETALRHSGVTPLYSFTQRESEEQAQPDGTVRKVAVFRHVGFVEV